VIQDQARSLHLPANLPDVSTARLPVTYKSAKSALAECSRIDECQDWADKMQAMASYARQAEDDSLRKMCDRIQGRAIRRCGDLLAAIEPAPGGRPAKTNDGGDTSYSRKAVATEAGLSERQRNTALRVANIPAEEFEAAIESDDPPTVTELAKRGTVTRPKPRRIRGLLPGDYVAFCNAVGYVVEFSKVASVDLGMVVRTCNTEERALLRAGLTTMRSWVESLSLLIEE